MVSVEWEASVISMPACLFVLEFEDHLLTKEENKLAEEEHAWEGIPVDNLEVNAVMK